MYEYQTYFITDGEPICGLLTIPPYLVVATWGGTVQLRNLDSPYDLIREITNKDSPFSCLTKLNNLLFISRQNRNIEIWDLNQDILIEQIQTKIINPTYMTATNNYLIIANGNTIEIFDQKTRKSLKFFEISLNFDHHTIEAIYTQGDTLLIKYHYEEKIHFHELKSFKEVYTFTAEPSIGFFFAAESFLFIGTDECVETGFDVCTLNVWDIHSLNSPKRLRKLGGLEDEFYFDMKKTDPINNQPSYLVTATINTVDIWEWGIWKHIDRIEDVGAAHHCQLIPGKLLVGDVEGVVRIWQKK